MFGLISLMLVIGLIWLEIVVFGLVGHEIGVGLTIIGVFVTAAIGIRLFRISGRSTLQRLTATIAQGRTPLLEVADGTAIMLAAALLLIPGYATDALGFVLFIPVLRTGIMVMLLTLIRRVAPSMNRSGYAFSMKHMGKHMDDVMNQNADAGSEWQNRGHAPLNDTDNDEKDASDVTIEGDYKRDD